MCGFVGVLKPAHAGPVDASMLEALLPWIRHRGPDQEGVYAKEGFGVAAARLAIRGGSEGDQPLVGADGDVFVFNGELLDADAHENDTLRLRALGGGVATLDGNMGAFAHRDAGTGALHLDVDPLGIKPLFVAERESGIWFASELKPLLAAHPALRQLECAGLAELLHFQRPRTTLPFAHVRPVRALESHLHVFDGCGTLSLGGEPAAPGAPSGTDPVADVRTALEQGARRAAAVDGPVSLFLSGGLDSSAVAAFCGRDDVLCLTGRFDAPDGSLDESEDAAATAAMHGLRHEVIDLRDQDLIQDLPDVIRALEVPMMGPGSLALWRMAKRAKEHGKVVLTGTGGDELFGGYARTALALGRAGPWTKGYEGLRAKIEAAGDDPNARMRAAFSRFDDLQPVLDEDFLRSLPAPEAPSVRPGESLLGALLREEREGTLRGLHHVEDRVTSAHGLEGRPVLSLGEVPVVAGWLPDEWLVGPDGEGKRALREALRGSIPEHVRTNPRKRGFPTPFARAARGVGRAWVLDLMHDARFVQRGWWNVDACRALLDAQRPVHDRALWAVCTWETWARLFLDGDLFHEGGTR